MELGSWDDGFVILWKYKLTLLGITTTVFSSGFLIKIKVI